MKKFALILILFFAGLFNVHSQAMFTDYDEYDTTEIQVDSIGSVLNYSKVLSTDIDFAGDSIVEQRLYFSVATVACGTPFLSTGYPAWTNYWAGWMIKIINNNSCPIIINSFEARFQGTSGYRIYTKTGTFIGFETNSAAWTLVGSLASLTGVSTVGPTAIPIVVNVTIPAGGSQSFYLTRSDNLTANRHLYVPGTGTAGTTIYASNADLSITEGEYVDPFFAVLEVGVRRPSFDVCYTISCPLPIELLSFTATPNGNSNLLKWSTATETNNDYFAIEKTGDGISWTEIGRVVGAGNSTHILNYQFSDNNLIAGVSYYRLKQVDYNGQYTYSNIVAIDNGFLAKKIVRTTNIIGQEVSSDFDGVKLIYYSDGTVVKTMGK